MADINGNKTGGRTKGTPNKIDSDTKQFLNDIVSNNQDKIEQELDKLDGKAYLDAVFNLIEYIQPKLSRTEVKAEVEITKRKLGYGKTE